MRNLILMITLTTFVAIQTLADHIPIQDGKSYIVDDDRYSGDHLQLDIDISNQPGTHVDIINTASIGQLETYRFSSAAMLNGEVFEIWAYGNSTVDMQGGSTWELFTFDDVTATVTGGTIKGYLISHDNSSITMSGGTVGLFLAAGEDSTIYLDGSNFEINGTQLFNGDRLSNFSNRDYIKGILADGSVMNTEFRIDDSGTADIIIIPEPATLSLLLIGAGYLLRTNV